MNLIPCLYKINIDMIKKSNDTVYFIKKLFIFFSFNLLNASELVIFQI